MPVVQTPIPGEQLANMDEQVRATVGAIPPVSAVPQEMLQQVVAAAPEQELARLASAMNAPIPPEMPVIPMAQGGLPTVRLYGPGGASGGNPNPYGTPMYGHGVTTNPEAMMVTQGQINDPRYAQKLTLADWNAAYGPGTVGAAPDSGGGAVVADDTGSTRGPLQTLSLGEYTPPPADYQHGIDPQWNFYPGSSTTTMSSPIPLYEPPDPSTVDMNTGGMVQDAMRLQSAGSGPHDRLVHMTQNEVDALNALSASGIGGLRANGMAINPNTGLPEAGIWSSILPMIAGLGLTIASGGTAAPWALGLAGAGGSLAGQAIEGEGIDMGRAFLAGLGGWGAGQLGQVFGGAGEVTAAQAAAAQAPAQIGQGVSSGAPTFATAGWGADANLLANVAPGSLGANVAAPNAFSSLTANLPTDVGTKLSAQHLTDPSAALRAAGKEAWKLNPNMAAVGKGIEGYSPTTWASTPGAVGLKETLMPGGAVAASAADSFGLFDPPETDWGESTGIEGYNYQGPYLPYPQTAVAPPEGFQPGIDPQFQYFSYGNKGGYVGRLPTIRAQSGYEQIGVPPNQQQQQGSQVFNQLAMMGAGLGGQQQAGATPLNQIMQQRAQRKQPLPIYTSSIDPNKIPMVRPQGMPQQTAMAAHGGPVGNLIDPQYRWSDTPDPMMREQVYRRANGGLAGIDPQYRWSDTANPATREHLYRPTVRMKEGTGKRGAGWHYRQQTERNEAWDRLTPRQQAQTRENRSERLSRADRKRLENAYEYLGERQGYQYTGAMDMPTADDWATIAYEGMVSPSGHRTRTTAPQNIGGMRPYAVKRANGGMVGLPTVRMQGNTAGTVPQIDTPLIDPKYLEGLVDLYRRSQGKAADVRQQAKGLYQQGKRLPAQLSDAAMKAALEQGMPLARQAGVTGGAALENASARLFPQQTRIRNQMAVQEMQRRGSPGAGMDFPTVRRQAGGLAGIDPQYRWSDVQNPAAREHRYLPTVKAVGGLLPLVGKLATGATGLGGLGLGVAKKWLDAQRTGGFAHEDAVAKKKKGEERKLQARKGLQSYRDQIYPRLNTNKGNPDSYSTDDVNPAAAAAMKMDHYNKEVAEDGTGGLYFPPPDIPTNKHQAGGIAGIDPQYRWSDVPNPADREHIYHPTVRAEEGKRGDEGPEFSDMYDLNNEQYDLFVKAFPDWRSIFGRGSQERTVAQESVLHNTIAALRGGKDWAPEELRSMARFGGPGNWRGVGDIPDTSGMEKGLGYIPETGEIWEVREKAVGGVAGEPEISETGIMEVSTPDMQEVVAGREMVTPAPDQPQNPAERAVFDQALLALQGELEPEPAQAAITEFIDTFGPEAFRQLQALVSGERENGGLVQPANGETTVGMTEEEAMAQQGPDVIPGKIVDPTTGKQTANLLVGENEYIEPADSLSRRAMAAGMAGTPQNGAMVRGQEEEQLRRAYG